jgi:hypothetical protein
MREVYSPDWRTTCAPAQFVRGRNTEPGANSGPPLAQRKTTLRLLTTLLQRSTRPLLARIRDRRTGYWRPASGSSGVSYCVAPVEHPANDDASALLLRSSPIPLHCLLLFETITGPTLARTPAGTRFQLHRGTNKCRISLSCSMASSLPNECPRGLSNSRANVE